MEQSFKIREAVIGDSEIVYRFICHLEEKLFDLSRFKDRYSENLENPDLIYLVAVHEAGEVIGFISCHGQNLLHHEKTVFEIQELYVARNSRDLGIGKSLVLAIEDRLRKMPSENLEVATSVKRSDARKFYARIGFIQTHIKFIKPD